MVPSAIVPASGLAQKNWKTLVVVNVRFGTQST